LATLLTQQGAPYFLIGIAVLMTIFCGLRALPTRLLPTALQLDRIDAKTRIIALAILASVAVGPYFYGNRAGAWLHHWDLFHTVIGTKYFQELGYTRLYQCSYALDREDGKRFPTLKKMRDLARDRTVPTSEALKGNDCSTRFSPERKQQINEDLAFFNAIASRSRWHQLFNDKGFNGTPFYVAVCQALIPKGPLNLSSLYAFATIDLIMLALSFGMLGFAFGGETALLALLFFCVNFPGNYAHMGGSLLRFDYVAALMAGLACLKLKRPVFAGVLLTYAAFERVYPVLFIVGAVLHMGYAARAERQLARDARFFVLSVLATTVVCFTVSLLPGGLMAWKDWLDNMLVHTRVSAGLRMGFQHMFMMQGNLTGDDGFVSYPAKAKYLAHLKPLYGLCVLLLLAPSAGLIRRLNRLDFASYFQLLTFFLLVVATRYYYALLVVAMLLTLKDDKSDPPRSIWGLRTLFFACAAIGWSASRVTQFYPFLYNTLATCLVLLCMVATTLVLLHETGLLGHIRDRLRRTKPTATP
jgi:hypothetical protein